MAKAQSKGPDSPAGNPECGLKTTDSQLPVLSDQRLQLTPEFAPHLGKDQEREAFFAEMKQGFADLRADEVAWAEYQKELSLWDITLKDGLDGF